MVETVLVQDVLCGDKISITAYYKGNKRYLTPREKKTKYVACEILYTAVKDDTVFTYSVYFVIFYWLVIPVVPDNGWRWVSFGTAEELDFAVLILQPGHSPHVNTRWLAFTRQ